MYIKEYFVSFCCIIFLIAGCGEEQQAPEDPRDAFFDLLASYCGETFEGVGVYPDDPDHDLIDTPLVLYVDSCTEDEIRIPFHAGEDRSRTFVITKTEDGLQLKHDHRDPETGIEHDLTNYGGIATREGTSTRQYFAADEETVEMLPEAATNVWKMELFEETGEFIYYLERHQEPRFRAEFQLQ